MSSRIRFLNYIWFSEQKITSSVRLQLYTNDQVVSHFHLCKMREWRVFGWSISRLCWFVWLICWERKTLYAKKQAEERDWASTIHIQLVELASRSVHTLDEDDEGLIRCTKSRLIIIFTGFLLKADVLPPSLFKCQFRFSFKSIFLKFDYIYWKY